MTGRQMALDALELKRAQARGLYPEADLRELDEIIAYVRSWGSSKSKSHEARAAERQAQA